MERFAGLVWSVPRGSGLGPAASADVAQTAWLRLAERLAAVPGEQVGGWLAAAARQEAVRALRWVVDHEEHGAVSSPLAAALHALPARARFALRVACVDPVPDAEALSAALAVPAPHAEALVQQGLDQLRRQRGELDGLPDDQVRAQLRAAVDDPVPAAVLAAARAAYSWRTLEAELVPAARDSLDEELASVRGSTDSRLLTYDTSQGRVEMEVAVERGRCSLIGTVAPGARLQLLRADGSRQQVEVDELGRFAVEDIAPGPAAFVVQVAATTLRTDWVVV